MRFGLVGLDHVTVLMFDTEQYWLLMGEKNCLD